MSKVKVSERKVPVIRPKDVEIQSEGFSYKTVIVRLPEDLSFQDLNDSPEIWRNVQADHTVALCEYDKLELRARGWTAWASVNYAAGTKVILYDIRKTTKPDREVSLYSDDTFEVRWGKDGYTYHRKNDGVTMSTGSYPTAEAAKTALIREQYPVTIS